MGFNSVFKELTFTAAFVLWDSPSAELLSHWLPDTTSYVSFHFHYPLQVASVCRGRQTLPRFSLLSKYQALCYMNK